MELRGVAAVAALSFFSGMLLPRILGSGIAGLHEKDWSLIARKLQGDSTPVDDGKAVEADAAAEERKVPPEVQDDHTAEGNAAVAEVQGEHLVDNEEGLDKEGKVPAEAGDEDTDWGFAKEAGEGEEGKEQGLNINIERAVSIMTLGSVAFQMSLFYLVNHVDEDMRRYSFGVIGETISIFCAVLSFNVSYSWIEEYTDLLNDNLQMVCFAVMCIFFYVFMECVVMFSARVRGDRAYKKSTLHGKELHVLKHVLSAKTFGSLTAQMCGAACVRGFGHLQLRAYQDAHSVWLAVSVLPLAFVFFIATMCLSTKIRQVIVYCDGVVGETEVAWAEIAEECENEVCGLCMGFLMATCARIFFTGSLPYILMNAFAKEEELQLANMQDVLELMLFGSFTACIAFGLVLVTFGHIDASVNSETVQSSFAARLVLLIIKTFGFNASWCFCFGMHLLSIQMYIFEEGIRLRLILALVQSLLSFVVIQLLDFFTNMKCYGPAFDKAIVAIIESLAVCIGLSWEHAFHACVDISVEFMVEDKVLFKASDDPKFWSVWLSAIIVIVVLPAYRLYIVPTRYILLEDFEHRMRDHAEIYRASYRKATQKIGPDCQEQTFQFATGHEFHEDSGVSGLVTASTTPTVV